MARPQGGTAGAANAENGVRFGATDAAMLLTTLIWAVNFSVVKYGIRVLPPHGFNGVRMTLAALIYLAVWAFLRDGFVLRKSDLWKAAGLGLLGTTTYQVLFIEGLRVTTASTTSMIAPMTPVFIALLSHFLRYERIHWAAWVGIAVSFTGFYLLLTGQGGPMTLNSATVRANLLILVANLSWACYTVLSRPLLRRIPPLRLAILTTSFGVAVLPALRGPRRRRNPLRPDPCPGLGSDPLRRRPGHRRRLCPLLRLGPQGRQHEDRHLQQPQPRLRHDLRRPRLRGEGDPPPGRRRARHLPRRVSDPVGIPVFPEGRAIGPKPH